MAGSVESACIVQVNNMNHLQRMIDISATNLDGLRTQCTTSSDLIQQEIRDQEVCVAYLFKIYGELNWSYKMKRVFLKQLVLIASFSGGSVAIIANTDVLFYLGRVQATVYLGKYHSQVRFSFLSVEPKPFYLYCR